MKTNKGFSLVELIIVMAIMGIMASIASFAWQRYVDNANLRTAARDLVSDLQNCKTKAVAEARNYTMSFTTGINSSYTIAAAATALFATVNMVKPSTPYSSGIQIDSAAFFNAPVTSMSFQTRGTCSNGKVVMTNKRGSTATITTNITGKAYVTFSMQ